MKRQFLIINGVSLDDNTKQIHIIIKSSNPFVLLIKYMNWIKGPGRNVFIKGYAIYNEKGESGSNHPINSGAYLHTELHELSDQYELNIIS